MPSKPKKAKLNATTPEILNAVRSDLSPEYQNAVPLADGNDIHTLYAIGKVIMNFEPHKNAFLNALVNRIAFVRITNQLFYNPWSFFKQGRMENGETVEEVFTQIASPFNFDPEVAESEVFKRVIPDVRAAFHTMNYQQFYKQTISDDQLAQAFLSWSGVSDMIASIVNAIYSAANQDEYLTMKYMIQRAYLDGNIKTVTIPTLNSDNIKTSVSQVKALSNTLTFMSDQYNAAGVTTFTPNTDQIVLLDTLADALIDVELLAGAFNLPYANLLQQRILVDNFTTNDYTRLAKLFANDPNYKPFTQEEVAKLQKIQMCVLDKGWFMIFDNLEKFTEQYNAQGLYWNYFFHVWKTFSYSPFKNAVMLVSEGSGVTGLTVSPDSATIERGESANFTAAATGSTTTPDVVWSLSDIHPEPGIASLVPLLSTITQDGIVTIAENEPNDTLYAVATLKSDPTIIGYSVITVTPEPTITSISISPVTAIMAPGDSREFTAIVQGSSTANLGYYMNISGNTSPSTLISPSGSLTLGSDEKATSITVTATSVQDHSFTALALVTVTQPERGGIVINGLEVQSKAIEVKAGQEVTPLTLTANVTGLTDKTVTWTLPSPAPGITMTESSDTITLSVDFTESSMVSGTYKITAANAQGMTADYYLQIAVPPAIIITPATQTITDAGSVTYTVTPYGITSPNYTWEVQGNPTGITMANGVVTVASDATNGTYTVLCQETTENVGAEAKLVVQISSSGLLANRTASKFIGMNGALLCATYTENIQPTLSLSGSNASLISNNLPSGNPLSVSGTIVLGNQKYFCAIPTMGITGNAPVGSQISYSFSLGSKTVNGAITSSVQCANPAASGYYPYANMSLPQQCGADIEQGNLRIWLYNSLVAPLSSDISICLGITQYQPTYTSVAGVTWGNTSGARFMAVIPLQTLKAQIAQALGTYSPGKYVFRATLRSESTPSNSNIIAQNFMIISLPTIS